MANEEIIVPSSPTDREAIKVCIRDISNIMTIIEGKRAAIKDEIDGIAEKFNLPKKAVRRMAKLYHAQTFKAETEEAEAIENLYVAVFPEQTV